MTGAHYYDSKGELTNPSSPGAFVSPTTILGIRKKSFLQDWRDRVGPEEADRISKVATDRGSSVHAAVESILLSKGWNDLATDIKPLVMGFYAWYEKYHPETVAIEAFCRSEMHEFAGRVDYICRIDGELWIIDWKTFFKKEDSEYAGKINQDYELQLAAYREAWQEMTGERARTKIVQLTDAIRRGYREKEMDGDFGIFMAHKEVYDYAVSIGEIKLPTPTQHLIY